MDNTVAAYCAGMYDGEGWLVIGLERGKEGRSDLHHIGVYVTQRVRHRAALDLFQTHFGGIISVRDTRVKGSENWAEQANWHIHRRDQIERFCLAVQPHCIVKAQQIAIALEYVTGFVVAPNVRDALGRLHGRSLGEAEVERRERLRLALKAANAKGPERTIKIEHAPRSAVRVARPKEAPPANPATVNRGETHHNAALTEDAVRTIRRDYAAGTATMAELARRYGVSWPAIKFVVNRVTWKHVTDLPDSPPPAPSLIVDQLGLFGPDA